MTTLLLKLLEEILVYEALQPELIYGYLIPG